MFHAIHFRVLQLIITVGLILCIVGGASSTSSTGAYQPQSTTKAGVVLYIFAFVILVLIAAVIATKLSHAPSDERWLLWAVIIAFPFILVRIIYSLISVFAHNRKFNLITGSVVIHVFMSVLEEMAVVIIYLAVGWKIETPARTDRGPVESREWKGNLADVGATQGGVGATQDGIGVTQGGVGATQGGNEKRRRQGGSGRRRRQGPIHALVGAGISAVQRKREGNSERSEV
jgi:hypothetical protein